MKKDWNSKEIKKSNWKKEPVFSLWEYRHKDFFCENSIFWYQKDAKKWLEDHGYKYVKRESFWVDKENEEESIEKGNYFIIWPRTAWKRNEI